MTILRPPLPPPLSHEGITFVAGRPTSAALPEEIVLRIAAALSAALPPGDFEVSQSGALIFSSNEPPSQWRSAARLEGIDRSTR